LKDIISLREEKKHLDQILNFCDFEVFILFTYFHRM